MLPGAGHGQCHTQRPRDAAQEAGSPCAHGVCALRVPKAHPSRHCSWSPGGCSISEEDNHCTWKLPGPSGAHVCLERGGVQNGRESHSF